MGLRRYRELLSIPGVPRLMLAAFVGRLPYGMSVLSLILLLRAHGFGYAAVGVITAASAFSIGVAAPVLGRVVDRVGQTRPLVITSALTAVTGVALVVAAAAGAGAGLLTALAFAEGLSAPPLSPSMRTLFPEVVGKERVDTAFAFDALQLELVFILGPLLAGALAAGISPEVGFLAAVGLQAAGALILASSPASRGWRPPPREAPGRVAGRRRADRGVAPGFTRLAARAARGRRAARRCARAAGPAGAGGLDRGRRRVARRTRDRDRRVRRAPRDPRRRRLAVRAVGPRLADRRALVRRASVAPATPRPLPAAHRRARRGAVAAPAGGLDGRVRRAGGGRRPRAGPLDGRRLLADRRPRLGRRDDRGLLVADRRLRGRERGRRVARGRGRRQPGRRRRAGLRPGRRRARPADRAGGAPLAQGVSTTFPTLRRSASIRCASAARSKGNASATTGSIVPSAISSASGSIHGRSVPACSHSRSMLRPITALEAPICLIRLKRGILTAAFAAVTRLRFSPLITAEAPNAIRRPPGLSRSYEVRNDGPPIASMITSNLGSPFSQPRCR